MNNRQRFEKWVSDTYGYSVQRYNDGPMEYMRREVEKLWTAWQAAQTAQGDGEPVAWTVVDPDGKSSIGGWQDMSTHGFWKETVVLREGHDFAYAYAGGVEHPVGVITLVTDPMVNAALDAYLENKHFPLWSQLKESLIAASKVSAVQATANQQAAAQAIVIVTAEGFRWDGEKWLAENPKAPPRVTVRVEGIGAVTLDVVDGGIDLPVDTIKGLAAQLGAHAAHMGGYNAQDMATQGADGFRNGYQAGYADAVTVHVETLRVLSDRWANDRSYTGSPVDDIRAMIDSARGQQAAPASADSSEAKLNCIVCAGSGHIADARSNPYLLSIAELAERIKTHTRFNNLSCSASDIHSLAYAIAETVKRLQALSKEGVG